MNIKFISPKNSLGIVQEDTWRNDYHIYQPLRSGRIWHKVDF